MDADARSLLAALLENPADGPLRLVLADCLEEQGDGRAAKLRSARPRAHCRLLPLEADGPPPEEFWSERPDRIVMPRPWEFHAEVGGSIRAACTEAGGTSVRVRVFYPAGPTLFDFDLGRHATWGWTPAPAHAPVRLDYGVGFGIGGEGAVRFLSHHGEYSLIATLASERIGWLRLLGGLFPGA